MDDPNATDEETEVALAERLADLPDHLRDEADAAVASARDADELVDRLADLRTERDVANQADGTEAAPASESDENDDSVFGRVRSTLDDVRDRATGDDGTSVGDTNADPPVLPGVERSRELAADARSTSVPSLDRDVPLPSVDTDRTRDRTRDAVRAARDRAGAGALELKRTVRDADPKQAALWGLATGVTVANPAIAASYSTAALLSGAVLGGGVVGAYASSHEDTVFDDMDPTMMARRANAGASTGAGARNIDGKSVGAMVGASAYLAEELTPTEYAQWVTEADAESVLRGAEMGAGRAAASDDFEGGRSGAALGGGLGLLYGLAADDDATADDHLIRELLDDDLWNEYTGRLGDNEGDGAATVEGRLVDGDDEDGIDADDGSAAELGDE
ncbi:hypothetical protein [Halococcus saccharolyticus]|uniref:Uncharacterized protein n=1 Tax=Halococcus saccharolyticus DSM 5350 TaxID=1227455 RepID=M0MBS3_9EURY|nr:hypothetical protein [Halococcus saccharolyticus]EMA43227.1 hypothetical protein C449_14652 [Halococcus saccharolyticus DSM 5350]